MYVLHEQVLFVVDMQAYNKFTNLINVLLLSSVNACIICCLDGYAFAGVYTGSKGNDLKPLFGAMFSDYIHSSTNAYTHWGWVDLDCVLGDMSGTASGVNINVIIFFDRFS